MSYVSGELGNTIVFGQTRAGKSTLTGELLASLIVDLFGGVEQAEESVPVNTGDGSESNQD